MPPKKLVLALDTSAAHCAVALLFGDRILVERTEEMQKGQAERLFPLLKEVLTSAGKSWRDLDVIGVGIGPGNFTGIRLSVSAARGLALSLAIPAIGVSTLEALRVGATEPSLALVDARRGQLYVQSSDCEAPQMLGLDDLSAHFARIETCIGHRAEEVAEMLGGRTAAPVLPIATAIAKLTFSRIGTPKARPAPLYLKAADAAPSRDAAPVILE